MREILYRGKRVDNSEWVYGSYVETREEYTEEKVYAIFEKTAEHRCMGEYTDDGWHEVFPETVGQYTGFTDKNGKSVFEGDLVIARFWSDWCESYEKATGKVKFYNGRYIIDISPYCLKLNLYEHPEIEVVGNIHETVDKK